ncbi:hypothetical protein EV663_11739 [Rhodovulum bhavnagarense]|uniref:Polysaccharide deacetylase n=1 Tax=Rhodovulum bhavnagarense TaxID=992286 RepID=A0A4R2R822_9RHOB|nr:hypothetical protein [Rhodovulum bhavnagarense]TCP58773.1 hypothetical protein EV663_11739 [Rhodovulum bhavnagarense]
MSIARLIVDNLRHARGWSSDEKLLVLNVDDYGNVRLASARARAELEARITGFGGYMDCFDALETREDLEALFEVLEGVRDCAGEPAVMTAYALSANPDFERIRAERVYSYEPLPTTFARCAAQAPAAYEGAWSLWRDGERAGIFRPQFHGREHVNVALIETKLAQGHADLEANLALESMAGLSGVEEMPGVGFTHAFGGDNPNQLDRQREILRDGVKLFESVFGFTSKTFTPPAQKLPRALVNDLRPMGILTLDRPFIQRPAHGRFPRLPRLSFPTAPQKWQPGCIVRTVSFEPGQGSYSDPIGHALRQIEQAFRWRKPAVVSSHRVNFAGHIDPENRRKGLRALEELLHRIVATWPDVRFIGADDLAQTMLGKGHEAP